MLYDADGRPLPGSFAPVIVFDEIDGTCRTAYSPEELVQLSEEAKRRAEERDLFRSLSPEEFAALPDRAEEIREALKKAGEEVAAWARDHYPTSVLGVPHY